MRIKVDDIPDEGLLVHLDQEDDWALAAARDALDGEVADLVADLQLDRIAELVRVHGTAQARVARTCDRCGGDVSLFLSGAVELIYEPQPLPALAEELITDESALDIGWYDGKSIELADVLMEQLALWTPPRIVCGGEGITQIGQPWTCSMPDQPESPDLGTNKPFANLRLPE